MCCKPHCSSVEAADTSGQTCIGMPAPFGGQGTPGNGLVGGRGQGRMEARRGITGWGRVRWARVRPSIAGLSLGEAGPNTGHSPGPPLTMTRVLAVMSLPTIQ